HHRETTARLTRTRRLDGGVEGEQIGLLGNRRDQLDHIADTGRGGGELTDARIGPLGLFDGIARDHGGFLYLSSDLPDRGGHLLGGGGDRLNIGGGLFRRRGDDRGKLLGGGGGLGECDCGGLQLSGSGRYRFDDSAHCRLELAGELSHGRLAVCFRLRL